MEESSETENFPGTEDLWFSIGCIGDFIVESTTMRSNGKYNNTNKRITKKSREIVVQIINFISGQRHAFELVQREPTTGRK